ncbi:MAG: exonuclease SbcCD subunit D, partial [Candidatus Thorarchaeota archaeon]
MKYGFIADIHLSVTDSLSPIDPSISLSIRNIDKLNAIEEALKISIKKGCEAFFFLGDIYDKLNPTERLKEAFLRTILPYSKEIDIYIFPGNHDGADFTNNYLSETVILEGLDIPPLKVIHTPTTLYLNKGKDKFLIIPWIADHRVIKDIIDEQEEGLILLAHLEVFGAITSTEYQITQGLHPSVFQKFKFCAFGHYHRH